MDLSAPDSLESSRPLAGFRILDISSGIAGPYCTRLLASYGAEVLKVERPRLGDGSRRLGPFPGGVPDAEKSGLFAFLNRGKRGITLDVTRSDAQPLLDHLIAASDLVLTSLRPVTANDAGLTFDRVRGISGKTALVAVTNFGQHGPYRDYHATDAILYGLGGPMHVTGHAGREPLRLGPRVVEFNGGMMAAYACSLALFQLAMTGRGQFMDLSLLETQVASHDRQASFVMAAQFTGETFLRMNPALVSERVWPCADGYIDVGYNAVPFERVLAAIGRSDMKDDPRFTSVDARQTPESQAEFIAMFLGWMVEHTMLEAWTIFQEHEIPSGPVYTSKEILADPHFAERRIWDDLAIGEGTFRAPRDMPWNGVPASPSLAAPRLGEHNRPVFLGQLGVSETDLDALIAGGVI
ncbi:hypothetical protein AYO38_11295 [bacterium SCGC AG-212-C10]|nr:hypothetical protein AYO38_11295 [bacterium SCGC AG-212-C10]